ncbi:CDP-diacylglycerol-glycerol-3-phosphate 3-phosphatidyltransferase [Candidozyma pseudohaemuli]|uniref:CDP-diacylglycerol-glycerol-3-phosphate 3-phosphatidyltransferase n=1 Tax=Candidozyma pseudohaemuli TaxID=418784 RepID=A0A2P7YRP3_9ASCO|nr:CDP-diacylglycerol-glycerol-3-phosphate 3-phosphatidyltransferase [[Candida] pseudohaemulonii]PSK38624.1 CDP-diacylglycerol-glycerol-3-phosphate 3-phosphatidyltransferase [[Candida] pseudohaemulonii]
MLSLYPLRSLRSLRPLSVGPSLRFWASRLGSSQLRVPRQSFNISATQFQKKVEDKKLPPVTSKPEFKKVAASENFSIPKPSEISSQVYTVPNMLTMTRIATTPFIGYFLATGQSTPAIGLFVYSCITDFADGFIARKYNLKSVLGSILDPLADKFLMTVCTVALSVQHIMPWYAATLILGRDVLLSFVSFYIRWRSLPPPKNLKRFLDLSIPTHTVHPNLLGKVNTALQMFYIGGLVLLPWFDDMTGMHETLALVFEYFGYLVTATTFCSGASYLVGRNGAKLLGR